MLLAIVWDITTTKSDCDDVTSALECAVGHVTIDSTLVALVVKLHIFCGFDFRGTGSCLFCKGSFCAWARTVI